MREGADRVCVRVRAAVGLGKNRREPGQPWRCTQRKRVPLTWRHPPQAARATRRWTGRSALRRERPKVLGGDIIPTTAALRGGAGRRVHARTLQVDACHKLVQAGEVLHARQGVRTAQRRARMLGCKQTAVDRRRHLLNTRPCDCAAEGAAMRPRRLECYARMSGLHSLDTLATLVRL